MVMASITPRMKRHAIVLAIACAACVTWIGWQLSRASATPTDVPPSAQATNTNPAPAPPATSGDEVPTTSQITFTTVPPARATVMWGKTLLGRIAPHAALIITRPRDSGPLDVVVRANGYLPVHTRAHTFGDTTVSVKLTRPDQQDTLFGYKAPIDAGPPEDETLSAPPTAGDVQTPPQ
jgi:hypothetical protein